MGKVGVEISVPSTREDQRELDLSNDVDAGSKDATGVAEANEIVVGYGGVDQKRLGVESRSNDDRAGTSIDGKDNDTIRRELDKEERIHDYVVFD